MHNGTNPVVHIKCERYPWWEKGRFSHRETMICYQRYNDLLSEIQCFTIRDNRLANARKGRFRCVMQHVLTGKKLKKATKVWIITKKYLSLQSQNECFDYPVSFRVGARLNRHYSIFKQRVTSCGSFVILHSAECTEGWSEPGKLDTTERFKWKRNLV